MRALLLAVLFLAAPALAEGGKEAPAAVKKTRAPKKAAAEPKAGDDSEAAARQYFTDTVLVDQHGKRHRFYSDLLKGRIVLINFAFAACTTACSPLTANMAKVQKQLGERVGRDVWMFTLSVDPVNDTPETLKKFAAKFNVQPGWYFLTGNKEEIDNLLRKFGAYTARKEEHSTMLLVGDMRTGTWVKMGAMEKPERILFAVQNLNTPMPASAQ